MAPVHRWGSGAVRHYQVVEINGKRETVISRHASRWEASQAKKRLEGTLTGRLIIRVRYERLAY